MFNTPGASNVVVVFGRTYEKPRQVCGTLTLALTISIFRGLCNEQR